MVQKSSKATFIWEVQDGDVYRIKKVLNFWSLDVFSIEVLINYFIGHYFLTFPLEIGLRFYLVIKAT